MRQNTNPGSIMYVPAAKTRRKVSALCAVGGVNLTAKGRPSASGCRQRSFVGSSMSAKWTNKANEFYIRYIIKNDCLSRVNL